MCLAIPAQITALLENNQASVSLGGVTKTISLALVDHIEPGDYVLVHVGFALSKLDEADAQKTLALFQQIGGAP